MQTQILDTTIRDGSYAVDFKFTCSDVKNIVSRLVKLGIEYIEIGHGLGLNASSTERGKSLYSDIEYIVAAKSCSKDKELGVFCIPEIARIDDLFIAKEHGISFVRIGVTVDELYKATEYIKEAKKIGLKVMLNFMKSYAAAPEKFANAAYTAHQLGADYVYIVDSAGCMLPEDIERFYNAVRLKSKSIRIGFHGHNNLGMAVANNLKCVELGFDIVDCSFQGLGRSIGNTSTEMFVMALKKKYGEKILNMDIPCLLEYGYITLKEITNKDLYNPLDLVCGYTGFHSSFLKEIYKCCIEFEIDPLRLIIEYTKHNKVSLDHQLLEKIAKQLPKDKVDEHPYSFKKYFSNEYNS
jgi:4-hydroxy 2-oxovalerate aldolase/long-chain acyl-CoA synthetase